MDKEGKILGTLVALFMLVYLVGIALCTINESKDRECRIYLATTTALSPIDLISVCKGK